MTETEITRRELIRTLGRGLCLGALAATIAKAARRDPDVKCASRLCDQCPASRTCHKPQAKRIAVDGNQ